MAQRDALPNSDLAAWGRDEAKSQRNSPVAQLEQYRGAEATAVRGALSRGEESGRLLTVPGPTRRPSDALQWQLGRADRSMVHPLHISSACVSAAGGTHQRPLQCRP